MLQICNFLKIILFLGNSSLRSLDVVERKTPQEVLQEQTEEMMSETEKVKYSYMYSWGKKCNLYKTSSSFGSSGPTAREDA